MAGPLWILFAKNNITDSSAIEIINEVKIKKIILMDLYAKKPIATIINATNRNLNIVLFDHIKWSSVLFSCCWSFLSFFSSFLISKSSVLVTVLIDLILFLMNFVHFLMVFLIIKSEQWINFLVEVLIYNVLGFE